jgi:hypothetical protein
LQYVAEYVAHDFAQIRAFEIQNHAAAARLHGRARS